MTTPLLTLLLVALLAFQLKHFLVDFVFQDAWMAEGKHRPGNDFFPPLLAHSAMHAWWTFCIALMLTGYRFKASALMALVDLVTHFFVDRVKAGPKYLGRFKALSASEYVSIKEQLNAEYAPAVAAARQKLRHNTVFWVSLGLDQMAHHLVGIALSFAIVEARYGVALRLLGAR
jgi:hypothetical protein